MLEWSRPAALWVLVVPIVVLLLSLRRDRPRALPVGTFDLWRDLPPGAGGAGRRRRIPPARWLLLAALVAGSVALAGPRRSRRAPQRAWHVVVDPTPSMFLAQPDGVTRLDAALAVLDRLRAADVRVLWLRPDLGRDELAEGPFPAAWRAAPWPPRDAPGWERHDAPGTLWLTDAAPEPLPVLAGVAAGGGPAVPGPVGSVGTRWLDWDGAVLVEREGVPVRALTIADGLPPEVVEVARAWAAERGLVEGAAHEVALTLAPAPGDGVSSRPGQVRVGRVDVSAARRDPAAFAVDWAERLDAALLPARGTVSLAERAAAGPSLARAPRTEVALDARPPPPWPLVAVLAALAAGLAFLALVLGRGRL